MLPDRQLLECELLVIRCQRGDKTAFEQVVAMWERSLFYYLRRLAHSEEDAWDWLQETWIKTFRALPKLRDPRTLPAFLYATARRTALGHLRTQEFQKTANETIEENLEAAGNDAELFDNADAVHHALDQLPLPQREVLTLYFLEDLSLDEMALLMEIPLGTVKSRLHYAKRAIRQLLTGGEKDDR